jgi:hypothetical protein
MAGGWSDGSRTEFLPSFNFRRYFIERMADQIDNKATQVPADVQGEISSYGGEIASEVWEALESVRPFLTKSSNPHFSISMTGTGGVI